MKKKKPYKVLVALDPADAELLEQVVFRLRAEKTTVLRWALRWYAVAGPWRQPEEHLLPAATDRMEGLIVGPHVHKGADS